MNKRKLVGLFLVALMVLGAMMFFQGCDKPGVAKENIKLTTEYQCILMNNGQYFFAKMEKAGSAYPLLRDVIYVRQQIDPKTKETKSTLYRRSMEAHSPNMMYINASSIAFIEPVSPDSKVATLIKQGGSPKPDMLPPLSGPIKK
jgi:hypothetical protein